MKNISRLVGLATTALNKANSSGGAPGASGKDWRSIVRSAADSLTGDSRAADGAAGASAPDAHGRAAPSSRSSAPADRYSPPPADRYSPPPASASRHAAPGGREALSDSDRQAIARYDYVVETAAPHQIEAIHRDAFARLSTDQRAHIESRMRAELPAHEAPLSSDPAHLARAAARGEASRPGTLRSLLARSGGQRGAGIGTAVGAAGVGAAGAVLAAVAGGAIVSTVAGPLLADAAGLGIDFDAAAASLNVDELTGGIEAMGENASSVIGEQVSGLGEQVSQFEIPGFGSLGDLFGR